MATGTEIRPLHPGLKLLLMTAGFLVFIAGIQLFIFTEDTDRYFAWTVRPFLTAASLGGAYWSSFAMSLLASQKRSWVHARVVVPAVGTFTTLTLIATLIHIDRFHLGEEFDFVTQLVTWAWIGVYVIVPILLVIFTVAQLRMPGRDAPKMHPTPAWLGIALGIHAVIMVPLGIALFIFPEDTLSIWPWMLTPLTARVVGAWLIGLGLAAANVARERDWERVRVAISTYVVLGAVELIALARYSDDMNWDEIGAYVYLVFLLSILGVGIGASVIGRQVKSK